METLIRADLDYIWELTQDTDLHARWDLRFSRITPQDSLPGGGYRFTYERRIPWHTIAGTGTALGDRTGADGARTSALRFTTPDALSPLGDGRGYWRYVPTDEGVRFITGFDYEPGWGRLVDAFLMRRLIGWMTAWSFDRLRIWAESGVEPERWSPLSALAWWHPARPRAGRCLRQPTRGRVMEDSPDSLNTLEAP